MEADKWGRRIRAYRKLKGFTQQSFAKKLHISVSVLGEIERGVRIPSDSILNDISEVLDVPLEELTPKSQ